MNILFVSDGSINNPILHSQGIPLLNDLTERGNKVWMITFETERDFNLLEKFGLSIKFNWVSVYIRESILISNWFIQLIRKTNSIFSNVRRLNIQVVHARGFFPAFYLLIVKLFFIRKIKIVYDNRGVFIDEEIFKGHWKKDSFKVKFFRLVEKKILKHSDAIVVVSEMFKVHLLKNYSSIIRNENIFVITNKTKINKSTINFKQSNVEIIGVYSGSATQWQNLNEIKKIISYGIKNIPNLKFKIISYNNNLFESLFSNLNRDKIEIISKHPNQVSKGLSECDFAILVRENNLINNVASPLKFAEYLAAGLPIILSEGIGDTEEIVIRNNVGVIYNAENPKETLLKMLELLNDKSIKKRCIKCAEENFNIKKSFEEYYKIFNNL